MKDEFEELVEELDLDEVEDFDMQHADYDVYIYSYDENQSLIGEPNLFGRYADPELAISHAEELLEDSDAIRQYAAEDAAFVSIEVETTVERDDIVENIGTLFAEQCKL